MIDSWEKVILPQSHHVYFNILSQTTELPVNVGAGAVARGLKMLEAAG